MRVIIAGGTGFIGRALTRALIDEGHRVAILSRNPAPAQALGGVEWALWDARTPKGWEYLVEEADAVINLVGENIGGGRWTRERKARIRASRINAGQAITHAIEAASHRPAVLIQASGIGYYGFTGDQTVTEQSPAGDDFLSRVSVAWEESTKRVEALGVRQAITRNALVLDKQDGVFPLVLLPFRLFAGGPVGNGRQWFPWIHREDEVGVILFLMKNETANGAYNSVAPEAVTNAQLGRIIAKVMHRPYWMPAPGFALKAVLGEMSSLILTGQKAVPQRLEEAGYHFKFPRLQEALEDLL